MSFEIGERDFEKGGPTPTVETSTLHPFKQNGSLSSPTTQTIPAVVLSNSGKIMDQNSSVSSPAAQTASALVLSNSGNRMEQNSSVSSPASQGAPALVLSNSGKRIDQAGKKKYVKQVTGRHNDTELHLAAQRGDLVAVKQVLEGIDGQMINASGSDLDHEMAEIRSELVNEINELGCTALHIAAEKGDLDVVNELLKYSNQESVSRKTNSGFDALHIAAKHGHNAIVQVLLDHDPGLSKTPGPSNATTPLISAATMGHTEVVNELLSKDSSLLEISRANGKNALHLAARQGHIQIVKALLDKDPQLARRTDKKGQTALHMAVKGTSSELVRLLLEADAAIVMLPDKFGHTALHVATRKKRIEIVNELLRLPDSNVNVLNREHKTALDIAEGLPPSEEATEIKECLARHGALRANELNQPRDELRKTVTEIKKDVHTQLEQTRKTYKNVHGIAKDIKKLHREGINNATNSVTVVAVLFATVAFAAIFTVPGGNVNETGIAVDVSALSFKIFFIFNAIALFTSLAVVVVQITLVRGATKTERRVVGVINKLMWLASVCTSVAFIASAYIVVGRHHWWAAIFVTVIGGVIMGGVLGTMTYYVIKSKRSRSMRKKSSRRSVSKSWERYSDLSDSEFNPIYAL